MNLFARFATKTSASRRPATDVAPRATALIEPLEGRQLMAAQITGLELWTAGKSTDTKIQTINASTTANTYDVSAPGHTDKLDLRVITSGTPARSVKFQVYSPIFTDNPINRLSEGTENDAPYVLGGNLGFNFAGRLRGPKYGGDNKTAPYSLLALNGAATKRFVVRVQLAGDAKFREFIFTITRTNVVKPTVTSVNMLNTAGEPVTGTGAIKLDNTTVLRGVLGEKFTLVVTGTNVQSARLDLKTDGVSGYHTENYRPFSLYGEASSGAYITRAVTKAGTYTLLVDAFSGRGLKGTVAHREVSFRVID